MVDRSNRSVAKIKTNCDCHNKSDGKQGVPDAVISPVAQGIIVTNHFFPDLTGISPFGHEANSLMRNFQLKAIGTNKTPYKSVIKKYFLEVIQFFSKEFTISIIKSRQWNRRLIVE